MPTSLAAVAAVLLMVLAGCSDDDQGPGGDTAGTPSVPTSSTPSSDDPSSATSEPEATGPVDPCRLTTRSDWAPLLARDARRTVVPSHQISSVTPAVYECRLADPVTNRASLTFGYSLGPVDWAALRRYTKPQGGIGQRTPLSGIGDEAFITTGLVGVQAFARTGDHVVTVTAYDAVSSSRLTALLATLALEADPAWHAHPVALPEDCPAVDDPAVTGLLGEVSYARGDFFRIHGPEAFCHYVSNHGDLVALHVSRHRPRDYPTRVQQFILEHTVGSLVDPPPGRVRTLAQDRAERSWSSQTGEPAAGLHVIVNTSPNYLTGGEFTGGQRAAHLRFADRAARVVGRALPPK